MKFFIFSLMIILNACNKKDESVTTPSTPPDLGTYETCVNDEGLSSKTRLYLNENSFTASTWYYSQPDCQDLSKMFMETEVYSYTQKGTSLTGVTESVLMTILDSNVATALNSANFCGYNNWITQIPINLLGRNCEGTIINSGESTNFAFYKSKGKLIVKANGTKTSFTQIQKLSFDDAGQQATAGTFVYFDGSRGVHLTLNANSFTMVLYDETTHHYYTKSGTFTSANNHLTFTTITNTPDCANDENTPLTSNFQQNNLAISVDGHEAVVWIMEKMSYSSTLFRDSYLGAGYSTGCF